MEFVNTIYEARMTRDSEDQKVLTYTDCSERLYLTLLILQLLNQYPTYRQLASKYAGDTKHSNYNHFRMYSTDLYNFVYFVTGDDTVMQKLKDPDSASKLRKRTSFPVLGFNRYLGELQSGLIPSSSMQLFMSIENGLNIKNTDYKTVRRNLFDYNKLTVRDKESTVTRLLHAARAKLRSSDIIEHLEKLASQRDLETGDVKDMEPKISVPDVSTQGRDLALYRYLVGGTNLVAVKRFIDSALNGKSIPSSIVQAYLPAIQLIDDIVKAGPSYVSVLKALQSRAKKSRN
jgi:hypothetical protein